MSSACVVVLGYCRCGCCWCCCWRCCHCCCWCFLLVVGGLLLLLLLLPLDPLVSYIYIYIYIYISIVVGYVVPAHHPPLRKGRIFCATVRPITRMRWPTGVCCGIFAPTRCACRQHWDGVSVQHPLGLIFPTRLERWCGHHCRKLQLTVLEANMGFSPRLSVVAHVIFGIPLVHGDRCCLLACSVAVRNVVSKHLCSRHVGFPCVPEPCFGFRTHV